MQLDGVVEMGSISQFHKYYYFNYLSDL
jgi:hypothetical protein